MVIARAFVGLLLASVIAAAARRTRSLSSSGAIAAAGVGTLAVAAAWSWGALLLIYFVASSLLSRMGRERKEARTAAIVEKGGERDAAQVLANGGVFAIAALGTIVHPSLAWLALGAGSLAASAADTWATEIGTLYGGAPRSLLGGAFVPPGTSGGVTLLGTVGGIVGAAFIAMIVLSASSWLTIAAAVFAGGVAGLITDSLLGATLQARRWCDSCAHETERHVHHCGTATRAAGGLGWLDNDAVNFASNAIGGLLAALLLR
jgi:uncharacterized protein (TIGR00297 family)